MNSGDARFQSDDHCFIEIDGMRITNDRCWGDYVNLDGRFWKGIQKGKDGYPVKDIESGWYCIAGANDRYF